MADDDKDSKRSAAASSSSSGGGRTASSSATLDPKHADPSTWINVASRANGAVVSFNSSMDKRFPPSAVIDTAADDHGHGLTKPKAGGADGKEGTKCWLTTGMYPQELLIQLPKVAHICRFHVSMKHVKKFTLLRCDNPSVPVAFDPVFDGEFGEAHAHDVQEETQSREQPVVARYLKLRIDNGYEDFAAVFSVSAEGYFLD